METNNIAENKQKAALLPVSSLAYLGDAVLELMVRERLVKSGIAHPQEQASKYVTAVAQSAAVEKLMASFSEDEEAVYKRGRNSTHTAPKSATHAQYSRATGLECVFAYLHLSGDSDRLEELFKKGFEDTALTAEN